MKSLSLTALTLLFLFSSAQAQDLNVKYDKFKDSTNVMLNPVQLIGSITDGLLLSAIGSYSGQTPTPPEGILFIIISASSELQFNYDRELIFLIDGERLKMGNMERTHTTRQGEVTAEGLVIIMPFKTLERIAKAKILEGKIGSKEFIFTSEHFTALRKFISHMKP